MHNYSQQPTTFVNSIAGRMIFVLAIASALTSMPLLAATRDVEKDYNINYTSNHSSSAAIFWVNVTANGGKLKISGKVKRKNREKPVRPGHIDISIMDAKGVVLTVKSVVYIPRKIPKLLRKASKFSVEFPTIAPKGSTINLMYHKDSTVEPIKIEHNAEKTSK